MSQFTSRRSFVLSAATAAAALGLDGALAVAEARPNKHSRHPQMPHREVRHQRTPDPAPGYHRIKVGDAEITAIHDGVWEKPHNANYFSNATVDETKQALAAGGFTTAFVTIPITFSACSQRAPTRRYFPTPRSSFRPPSTSSGPIRR